MSQQMTELHGNTADLSCGNRDVLLRIKSLFWTTVLYVITTPGCVVFMCVSWFHLYSLCRFGRLHKNIPILLLCLLWWIGAVVYGLKLWRSYEGNRRRSLFEELIVEEGEMFLRRNPERYAGENTKQDRTVTEKFSERQIKWFIRKQDTFRFFLKDKRVLTLTLNGLNEETKDFLMLKISAVSFFGKKCWRVLASILLIVMTVLGASAVVKSAMPWQGKLGNYLQMWQNKRTVTLIHDNVYAYGIEGVLDDIRAEIDLPQTLCLSTSFNMHFAPDGKILSLDTMLYGFDEDRNFVDSYLISYTSSRSSKITVYLHGSGGGIYKEDKDLTPLIEAVSWIPLKQKVRQWEGEECYGILYYGKREWYDRDGIRILNADGTVGLPPDEENYFYGYSISLFCPDNEQLTPERYLYPDYRNTPVADKAESYPADYVPEVNEIDLVNQYMIPEQSFDISLNDWGEVRFVSCMPMRNPGYNTDPLADVSFYLLSDEQILYRFPYVNVREGDTYAGDTYKEEDNIRQWGLIDGISFVTFTDVNGDEKKDVIIGILYYTGAGPQGAIPRMEVRVYEDQGDGFVYDEALCSEYGGLPYDTTAAEVKEMIQERYAEVEDKKEADENKNSSQPYAKYSEVLMQILINRTDPDGRYFDDGGQGVDFSRNCFAITDIDGDGRDELIFNFNDTYMAAMRELVYDYDEENGTLRTELEDVFPFTAYYSNGYVKEDASHNHTCDPETRGIWPYNLYKYDADADSYINIGYVQCWDKLVFPTNYEDEAFPDEFDEDGDNLLFFVGYFSKEGDDVNYTYMDRKEFEAWEQAMFPGEYKIGIEYHHMTEEEIENVKK